MFPLLSIRPAFAPPPVFAESSDCRTALKSKLVKTPFSGRNRPDPLRYHATAKLFGRARMGFFYRGSQSECLVLIEQFRMPFHISKVFLR
jgi:plasmid stabilization system protein ParE